MVQQQFLHLIVSPFQRQLEWCPALVVMRVDINIELQQLLSDDRVSLA